ncbi:MAG: PIN domain-containing protein [Acidobacteriota bacterium]|nr:PIN domain-containing protein [Acidobacteriota bacterium]
MSLPAAFWDSSALIPLCISQPQTIAAQSLYAKYRIVVWWATDVEIVSGLTRLQRMGGITHKQFLLSKPFLQNLVCEWNAVHESAGIASSACSLLETHPLRAADALQLAAALEACEHKPRGHVFVTGDQRLADAARHIGFSVELV